jgi:enoyl-CoA hydratase/carnithine racemase
VANPEQSNAQQSNAQQSNAQQSNAQQPEAEQPSVEEPDTDSSKAEHSQPHPMLRVQRSGPVVVITLDAPQRRNSQVPSLWAALAEVGEALDPSVRVVLFRAEGPSFSAGLDRAMLTPQGAPGEPSILALAAGAAGELEDAIEQFQRGFSIWAQVPAITIAAVQGHAIGAGFQLALACDLRVVAADVAFAMRETSLGLVPDLAGTAPLVRAVGYARALEICATGRFVGAQEAVAIGLATVTVPADQLDATARELADAILNAPQAAVRELKPLLRSAIDASAADQLRAEREAQARLLTAMVAGPGK